MNAIELNVLQVIVDYLSQSNLNLTDIDMLSFEDACFRLKGHLDDLHWAMLSECPNDCCIVYTMSTKLGSTYVLYYK
ncbi:hypothetical protein [Streptococcus hyointestinalis]|uniref:hypothetical protein n=1 Tax=Streptococcus hyointestinalis TaxID=1337 RepID=UPI003CFDE6C2